MFDLQLQRSQKIIKDILCKYQDKEAGAIGTNSDEDETHDKHSEVLQGLEVNIFCGYGCVCVSCVKFWML